MFPPGRRLLPLPVERDGVRILRNEMPCIEPLNLSTPKGLRPLAQGCEERATLGTNAKYSFSLSSRGGRRGPGRGGVPGGGFMGGGSGNVNLFMGKNQPQSAVLAKTFSIKSRNPSH